MIDTGKTLKTCRLYKGMSIKELSRVSGVAVNTIWGAEQRPSCNMVTFDDLLDAMGFQIKIVPKETK